MADQAITALPKKTYSGSSKIAATDYLLGIDSAEGYQMLIQDLGEYIINKATASLAGSTQTLASAISALNSKTKAYDYVQSTGNFLDWVLSTFTVNGEYFVIHATGNTEGWAASSLGSCMVQKRNNDYFLTAYINDTATPNLQAIYVNRYVNSRWIGWTKLPTRAEIDGLNSKTSQLLTKVNENISDVEIRNCIKYGNVVMIAIKFTVSETITGNTDVLFSGAFAPAYNNIRFSIPYVTVNANSKMARIAIDTQGNIKNWYTPGEGITPNQYEATLMYLGA